MKRKEEKSFHSDIDFNDWIAVFLPFSPSLDSGQLLVSFWSETNHICMATDFAFWWSSSISF